uniref:uncharacterized protein LOC122601219 n=1 Tax=Erigeron canadensis TaxID=72917 RepID=UPI001CB937C3|nr:uncharacterized protein LOC122601219 [Erigeron canadensis]
MNERFDSQDARFKSIERDVKVIVDGFDYCGDDHYSEDCPDKPAQEVESDESVDDEIEMEPNPAVKTPAVPSKTVQSPTVERPPVKPCMPNYAKFLKELITDKKKLEEAKMAVMSAEVSAIIKNEIPPKLEDPGSFLISCAFGAYLCKALADLGASINLMPYSVGHMIFLVDFVILEMEEDVNVPLILGRPFLMTADAIIRVKAKEISLGVGDDRVAFNVDRALKHPYSCDESCFRIDVIEEEDALEKELMDILDMEDG